MSLTNCTPSTPATTVATFYDINYNPLGYTTPSTYAVYGTLVIPGSVRVGDTGFIGGITEYTDSTKTLIDGSEIISYIVEADTANTAVVNLIEQAYNASSVLTSTTQSRYRISTTGALIPISEDIQYASPSTTHLVIAYQ